jgi:hypothetical protein
LTSNGGCFYEEPVSEADSEFDGTAIINTNKAPNVQWHNNFLRDRIGIVSTLVLD